MKTMWLVVCAAVVVAVCVPARAVEPFDRLLPKETLGFASVRSVPDLLQRVRQLPFYTVLAQEGFLETLLPPEAYKEAGAFYNKYVQPLGGIFKGEVAFALWDIEMGDIDAGEPPPMVLLADVAATEPALHAYLEKAIYPFVDASDEVRREEARIGSVTVTRIVDVWDEEGTGALGVKDGVLLLFPHYGGAETFLKALGAQRDESLADNEWYGKVKASLAGADFVGYCNLGAIDRAAHKRMVADDWEEEYDVTWGVFHMVSGFKPLEAVGCGMTFGPNGGTRICFFGDGPHGGIFDALARKPPPLTSPTYLTEDAAVYAACSLGSFSRVYQQLAGIIKQLDPYTVEELEEAVAVIEEFFGKELEDEILPAFGGEVAVAAWIPPGLSVPPGALMIEVKDKKVVGEMVARVVGLIEDESGGEVQTDSHSYEGVEITSFLGVPEVTPAVAIVGDFLVVATKPGVIEEMVDTRAEGKHLGRCTNYARYVSAIPGDATITVYVDTRRIFEAGFPLLKEFLEMIEEDMGALEAVEALGGALSPFGMKVQGGENGIIITSRSDNGGLASMLLMTAFVGSAVTLEAHEIHRTPGKSEVEFGSPGGFVPEGTEDEDLGLEDDEDPGDIEEVLELDEINDE